MNVLERIGRTRVNTAAVHAMQHVLACRNTLPTEAHDLFFEDLMAMICAEKPKTVPKQYCLKLPPSEIIRGFLASKYNHNKKPEEIKDEKKDMKKDTKKTAKKSK